jgi:hypothetical protein
MSASNPGTPPLHVSTAPLCGNGDLNLNTSLDVDDDLLDNLGGGVEVDEALVDAHLKGVPGLGTLTVGGLTGGDLQDLGGQADGALDAELLVLGTVDELLAHLLEGLDVARGEGDSDLVDLGAIAEVLLGLVYVTVRFAHCYVSEGGPYCKTSCTDRWVVWSVVVLAVWLDFSHDLDP